MKKTLVVDLVNPRNTRILINGGNLAYFLGRRLKDYMVFVLDENNNQVTENMIPIFISEDEGDVFRMEERIKQYM